MLMLAFESPDHTNDSLVIIVDGDNIDRLQHFDPISVELRKAGKHLVNPTVHICFESDMRNLNKYIQINDMNGMLKYLGRGWQYRPDKGDHDRGPESIYTQN